MNRTESPRIVVIDNRDSFVYNLVDAVTAEGYRTQVLRSTVPAQAVAELEPSLVVLSPGPGHPRTAGNLMEILQLVRRRRVPVLGICLGFQALLEAYGVEVVPCGPVHGVTDELILTGEGQSSALFQGLADPATGRRVPVARYHSLGSTTVPDELHALGYADSTAGRVLMAACDDPARPQEIGLQFHPESVLTPDGPVLLARCIDRLLGPP